VSKPRCLDPELIIPISRGSTRVFKTGAWTDRQPFHREKLSPCRAACPVGNDIPRALTKAAAGDLDGALAVFLQENPLPGVCGRVCLHPCQPECNRAQWDGTVQVRALERAAADLGRALPPPLSDSGRGKPAAVVGSGPAGLAAAFHLARLGHPVDLYEARSSLGGVLSSAIPDFRLPAQALERDLERILGLGIKVHLETRLDRAGLKELLESRRAVFLALGAGRARVPEMEGLGLKGVLTGLEFLEAAKAGTPPPVTGRALIIGGGNVALDAALTARRLGAEEVILACLESREEMPALEEEVELALEEGIEIRPRLGPREVLGREDRVAGVRFSPCRSVFDSEGLFNPVLDQGRTLELEAGLVVLATGQEPDLGDLAGPELASTPRGGLQVVPETLAAGMPGVFAGGDLTGGPGSVALALAAGKRAAVSIHAYLTGRSELRVPDPALLAGGPGFSIQRLFRPETDQDLRRVVAFQDLEPLFLDHRPSRPLELLAPAERRAGFREAALPLSHDRAREEAGRCFNCGTCTGCDRCLLFCPDSSVRPPGEEGQGYCLDPDFCKGCGVCAQVCIRGVVGFGEEP